MISNLISGDLNYLFMAPSQHNHQEPFVKSTLMQLQRPVNLIFHCQLKNLIDGLSVNQFLMGLIPRVAKAIKCFQFYTGGSYGTRKQLIFLCIYPEIQFITHN